MTKTKIIAALAVAVLVAAACTREDEGGNGEDGSPQQEANTGTVNVLSALAAEEGEALQALVDEMITPEVDYQVEIEASDQFEEQFQIRAEAGTLDLILLPQPGALPPKAQS